MNALGEIRPSQFIFSFGVGALLDLPQLSVMILGLQNWEVRYSQELIEDRLLAALQRRLGRQVAQLLHPPIPPEDQDHNPAAPPIGVPVVPFPRWLRCPKCQGMGTIESGLFELVQDRYAPTSPATSMSVATNPANRPPPCRCAFCWPAATGT